MSEMVGMQRRLVQNINNNSNKIESNINTNEMKATNIGINSESDSKQVSNEDKNIQFGYYIHRNKLGEGGFGIVRLATHLKTGLKVALKIMNKNKLGTDLFRVRVEINSLKVLQHENIAKLLQVIETEEEIYLVLEYCSGGELFDYLVSKSRLTESESKTIMRDLVNALAFIHQNGFAHRDLKPENILFDSNHRIKLIDFGLAANCRESNASLTHLNTCCGSPAYAAPELLQGVHYSGPAVDVWSAGVLLYALLIGKLPFDDDNIGALYKKIQTGIYRLPEWLSREARDLIKSMLKTNPNERITINDMLSHPWICPESEHKKNSIQILKQNLDDEAFFNCHLLFPETQIKDLRYNILHGFGYQTATYWLIKDWNKTKPQSLNIRPPNSIAMSPINRQLLQRKRSKTSDEPQNKENETRPKLVGAKRKIIDSIKNSPNNKAMIASPEVKVNTPSKIPVLTPNKLTPKSKEVTKLVQNNSPLGSPVIPAKKPRLFRGLIDSNERNNKSPLKHLNFKSFTPKTPLNPKIECTPKKSLLKRFLETATPAKSQNPRTITTSTTSKNITLTSFTEPQQCIEKLIETLTAKGIQCKQKDFSLRCVLSTKNVVMLSFNLEICKFEDRCVIQRKRLKGNAWDYKKVCEEILRISNE